MPGIMHYQKQRISVAKIMSISPFHHVHAEIANRALGKQGGGVRRSLDTESGEYRGIMALCRLLPGGSQVREGKLGGVRLPEGGRNPSRAGG